jgi:amidase
MKALLEQEPWLHDPLVHELPWRYDQEREILQLTGGIGDASKVGKLAFGVLHTDGVVNPQPPIRRAIGIMVNALRDLGHEIVEWTPPPHKTLLDEGMKTWFFDGGVDVRTAFALSGEPVSEHIGMFDKLTREFTGSEIAATNIRLRELKKEYMDYWNSTAKSTTTGRPVDAFISPLAPFPAAIPKKYSYYGYSTFVNILDYTSVVVPVTTVDSSVDKVDEGYVPIDDLDKCIHESCKSIHLAPLYPGRRHSDFFR